MGDLASGMKTAVEMAVTGHAQPHATAEQLGMFADPAPALTPANGRDPGRAGRPVGAMNKRTEAWATFILSRYQSPLVFLAETYSRNNGALALELDCDKKEAFAIQQRAAEALLPYIHQKMPTAIQMDAKTAGMLVIGRIDPGTPAAGAIQAMGLTLTPAGQVEAPETQTDHEVAGDGAAGAAAPDPAVSHDAMSHDGGKP